MHCFIRFALPCPAASCVGKPTMVVVAVQGPPQPFLSLFLFLSSVQTRPNRYRTQTALRYYGPLSHQTRIINYQCRTPHKRCTQPSIVRGCADVLMETKKRSRRHRWSLDVPLLAFLRQTHGLEGSSLPKPEVMKMFLDLDQLTLRNIDGPKRRCDVRMDTLYSGE